MSFNAIRENKILTKISEFTVSNYDIWIFLTHQKSGKSILTRPKKCWKKPLCKDNLLLTFTTMLSAVVFWKSLYQTVPTQISLLPMEQSVIWMLVCFCCFTSQVNSYGHCGTVSSPNHTFSWAGLNKQLTSNLCTYFRLFWMQNKINLLSEKLQ